MWMSGYVDMGMGGYEKRKQRCRGKEEQRRIQNGDTGIRG
jgi:hypothetical protein